jgi:hypothetical protein
MIRRHAHAASAISSARRNHRFRTT